MRKRFVKIFKNKKKNKKGNENDKGVGGKSKSKIRTPSTP